MGTHKHEPLVRTRSPIDPAPGSWAVVGAGTRGQVAARALRSRGLTVVAYEARTDVGLGTADVLAGHEVLAIEEIEDIDALGVTTHDHGTGTMSTDYFAGVVVATGPLAAGEKVGFLDDEMLNIHGGRPRLAREMFTPHHPALILLGISGGFLDSLDSESRVISRYAALLRDDPRAALEFHRRACLPLLDSLALAQHPDRADVSEQQRRDLLAADLTTLGA